jgi:hypothetical protein
MLNKMFWLGILVLALVFGITVIGCDDGSNDDGGDTVLNGTWVDEDGMELKFDNGNFEISDFVKGTYTTSGSNITITITQIHGDMMEGMLDSEWYTKAELKASAIGSLISDEELNEMFSSQTGSYSISGNKLTMTLDGEMQMFTKK